MMNNSTVKYSMRYVLALKRIKKYENLTFDIMCQRPLINTKFICGECMTFH